MKVFGIGVAAVMLAGAVAARGETTGASDMAGARTPNGRVAVGWIDSLFNRCDPAGAFERYVDLSRYRAHPAPEGDVVAAEEATFRTVCAQGIRANVKAVIAQRDLVAVLVQLTTRPYETEHTEWFRLRKGRIVDHWVMSKPMKAGQRAFD